MSVSKETISRITDKVIEEMTDWSHRPLDEIYAAVFINAIVVTREVYGTSFQLSRYQAAMWVTSKTNPVS